MDVRHSQADSVMGHTLVDFEFVGERGLDPKGLVASFFAHRQDGSHRFNDTGEHASKVGKA